MRELLNAPLEQFEQLPYSAEDLEAMNIVVDYQKELPEAPSWCVVFVELLKYVFQFKEWVHTMDRQTDVDFEQYTSLSFFIHTYMVLEILGLVKNQSNATEQNEDDNEQSSNNSFSHHSDRK